MRVDQKNVSNIDGTLLKHLFPFQSVSNPGTPKHSGLRNEICVIFFQRDSSNNVFSNLSEAMLRHLEGVKVAVRPYYSIYTAEDMRNMPHVRLYVIIVDLETRGAFLNGTDKDLVMMTIKHAKSLSKIFSCLYLYLRTYVLHGPISCCNQLLQLCTARIAWSDLVLRSASNFGVYVRGYEMLTNENQTTLW